MKKKSPFLIEIGLGLAISVAISWAYVTKARVIENSSLKTYDMLSKFRQAQPLSDAVRIVEIDELSLENLGRWPWPRSSGLVSVSRQYY